MKELREFAGLPGRSLEESDGRNYIGKKDDYYGYFPGEVIRELQKIRGLSFEEDDEGGAELFFTLDDIEDEDVREDEEAMVLVTFLDDPMEATVEANPPSDDLEFGPGMNYKKIRAMSQKECNTFVKKKMVPKVKKAIPKWVANVRKVFELD